MQEQHTSTPAGYELRANIGEMLTSNIFPSGLWMEEKCIKNIDDCEWDFQNGVGAERILKRKKSARCKEFFTQAFCARDQDGRKCFVII
jgi:hypothetical protein